LELELAVVIIIGDARVVGQKARLVHAQRLEHLVAAGAQRRVVRHLVQAVAAAAPRWHAQLVARLDVGAVRFNVEVEAVDEAQLGEGIAAGGRDCAPEVGGACFGGRAV
jgi:hypothetical protein